MPVETQDIRCPRCDKITPHLIKNDSCCSMANAEAKCTVCGMERNLGGTIHDLA